MWVWVILNMYHFLHSFYLDVFSLLQGYRIVFVVSFSYWGISHLGEIYRLMAMWLLRTRYYTTTRRWECNGRSSKDLRSAKLYRYGYKVQSPLSSYMDFILGWTDKIHMVLVLKAQLKALSACSVNCYKCFTRHCGKNIALLLQKWKNSRNFGSIYFSVGENIYLNYWLLALCNSAKVPPDTVLDA